MLSYQHAYHAGNFADVHKHLALYWLVRALHRKDSAISLIDTHAGRGLYPLSASETQKNGEYRAGVAQVWAQRNALDSASPIGEWLAQLATLQRGNTLACYPGSPWWLGGLQRPQDKLTLYELHPQEHASLTEQGLSTQSGQLRLHADGLEGLRNVLPVATPRVCVLIDPSYELKTEYRDVTKTIRQVARKARHAVVLLWYPILPSNPHERMLDSLRQSGIPKMWRSELNLGASAGEHGMQGSGLVLLNPPWQLDQQLGKAFSTLASMLADGASHRSGWLAGE